MKRRLLNHFLPHGLFLPFLIPLLCPFLFQQQIRAENLRVVLPPKDFSTPKRTFNYFLKTMKAYKLGNPQALDLAIQTFNLRENAPQNTNGHIHSQEKSRSEDGELQKLKGRQSALKLIQTLDRLEYVDVAPFPDKEWLRKNPEKKRWIYKSDNIQEGDHFFPVEISLERVPPHSQWLFSKATIESISLYERSIAHKDLVKGVSANSHWLPRIKESLRRKMPQWTGRHFFILMNGQWIGIFILIFLALLLERLIRVYLVKFISRLLARGGVSLPQKLNQKLTPPLGIILFASVWSLGVHLLEFDYSLLSWFLKAGEVAFTTGCVLALYQLVDLFCLYLEKRAQISENKFDDILVPLIRKSLKTFIVAVGIIAIGDALSLDMKGLLAGMGIVGLGVSLAAKDTLSNLFGSLTVLLDRPFRIGDWVNIDNSIEGTVEEVGLRSCRIRTFYNSLITIPNGMLTNASIDNYGMRTYRRFTTRMQLQYDTSPEKIESFCQGVRALILAHPHTRKDYFHVFLNELGPYGLEVLLYVFFITPDWGQELQERHNLIASILKLAKKEGVEFAFPTQTLHMVNEKNEERTKLDKEIGAR